MDRDALAVPALTPRLEPKLLYRRLDGLLGGFDPSRPPGDLLRRFLVDAFEALHEDLLLRAAFLFGERRNGFHLLASAGKPLTHVTDALDSCAAPLDLVLRHGVYIFESERDQEMAEALGVPPGAGAAGLVVGRRPRRHALLLALSEGWVREELDFALNTMRAALGARLIEERLRGSLREAAEIQQSLLPEEAPRFEGFDIACRSLPTEEVSGDFYDFHVLDRGMLGIAIGDASGHGLPSALLVRDVVTGLRMGVEQDLQPTRLVAKLNRVIHRSHLSSRFVSVFYGELGADGSLVYVNAGHPPPLLFDDDGVSELQRGGTVIGPLPEARFESGCAGLGPGATLVLCSDGILERRDAHGEFFGVEGLRRVVGGDRSASATAILDAVFGAALDHGGGQHWHDDATVVVIRRKP